MIPLRQIAPRRPFAAGGLGLLLAIAAGQPALPADAENGALIYRRCAACHEIDEPTNRIGPHLVGIVGRTAGTVSGYSYSAALAGSGIVWTEANLAAFLADPQGFVPGNRMAFPGLDDTDDRADLIAFLGAAPGPDDPGAADPEPIEAVATGAVAPLLARVAARFGADAGRLKPIVSRTTADDAIAQFCAGAGDDHPDLLGIARRLRQPDLDACAAGGGGALTEIKLGYEALVLATARSEPTRDVDLAQLWLALSDLVPGSGGLEASALQSWPEIDPRQPEGALPETLGMAGPRQLAALDELGLSRGCLAFPAVEASPLRHTACTSGRLQTVELPEGELPAALQSGVIDLALMTLAGFDAGRAALRPLRINGVKPAVASVRDRSYALAQPLYLYVKPARVEDQAGLAAYLEALTAETALAHGGDLGALGYVQLPRAERRAARQTARTLPALALEGPNLLPIAPTDPNSRVWSWASAAEMALRAAGLPPLENGATYRCNVVAARFGSCQPDCAACLNPVATVASLIRALDAYQEEALAQGLVPAPLINLATAARLKSGALGRIIRNQRSPVLAQIVPPGGSTFYPAGMTSHFALIVGHAGTGKQALLTVNDPYPYPEALNPYLDAGERTGEPGQYAISYGEFRQRLGYRQSVVLR